MAKIIIGIHGLANKPPKVILEKWWKLAIREGLQAIGHPRLFFKFELVYWAHFLYSKPLNPGIKNKKDPLYLGDPYVPAIHFSTKKAGKWRLKTRDLLETALDRIILKKDLSIHFSRIINFVVHRFFRDLYLYYSTSSGTDNNYNYLTQKVIRDQLAQTLEKHKRKQILLISHSMGSIIAYDVLTLVVPKIKIDTFVTLGSPLGLPNIIGKIASEHPEFKHNRKVKIPENIIRNWYNFSDLEDKVAVNYNLGDDFEPNSHQVYVTDVIVSNNYEINGNKDPHKSYGYLRTPEIAGVVHCFLNRGRSKLMIWLTDKINELFLRKSLVKLVPGHETTRNKNKTSL